MNPSFKAAVKLFNFMQIDFGETDTSHEPLGQSLKGNSSILFKGNYSIK